MPYDKAYHRKWRTENREKCHAYQKKWRDKNKEYNRERHKKFMKKNPGYAKKYRAAHVERERARVNEHAAIPENKAKREAKRLWDMYRLTPEEHARIREFQANHEIYKLVLGKNEGTDHDHKTGLIRGMMDWRINMALGLLESARRIGLSDLFRALAVYYEKPPAEIALGEKRFGLIGLAKYKKKMIYGPPIG